MAGTGPRRRMKTVRHTHASNAMEWGAEREEAGGSLPGRALDPYGLGWLPGPFPSPTLVSV